MPSKITWKFYWLEAERLLNLAASTIDRTTRMELLEMVASYREMAAQLRAGHAQPANANAAEKGTSETA